MISPALLFAAEEEAEGDKLQEEDVEEEEEEEEGIEPEAEGWREVEETAPAATRAAAVPKNCAWAWTACAAW